MGIKTLSEASDLIPLASTSSSVSNGTSIGFCPQYTCHYLRNTQIQPNQSLQMTLRYQYCGTPCLSGSKPLPQRSWDSLMPWMVCPAYFVVQGSGHPRQALSLLPHPLPPSPTKDRRTDGRFSRTPYFVLTLLEAPALSRPANFPRAHNPQRNVKRLVNTQSPWENLSDPEYSYSELLLFMYNTLEFTR